MQRQKRALAVHDISCLGKCSLTAALPILSAADIECVCLPTAVLSTHTGGFEGYTFRDLTADILPIAEHWRRLDLRFDAIYTGYLGSAEQIELVRQLFEMLAGDDTLRLVDPVMGDGGVLYKGFAPDYPRKMRALCAAADVIIPNITEASLLLDRPYREGPFERAYIEDTLAALAALGPKKVVLTGVSFDERQLGAAVWDNGHIDYAFAERIAGQYHGTGDVWGSSFLAGLLSGKTPVEAGAIACEFTTQAIRATRETPMERCYGVRFEAALPSLMHELGRI